MTQFATMARDRAKLSASLTGNERHCLNKWNLLKAVEDVRSDLKLNGTSLAILRALLTFVQHPTIDMNEPAHHICFASNAALSKRAHVSIQTIERHISKLAANGLVTRASSANGKRWARRNAQGVIQHATGLSLMPLVQRHAEFLALAQEQDRKQQALAKLRDDCAAALGSLVEKATDLAVLHDLQTFARNLFRRKPDAIALTAFLNKLRSYGAKTDALEPGKMRGNAHRNEGHKDTVSNPKVKEKKAETINVTTDQMERAYPKLCAELRFARTKHECERHMHDLAFQLGLGPIWAEVQNRGATLGFMILGYLFERADRLNSPKGYALSLLRKIDSNQIGYRTLLSPPMRVKRNTPLPS